MKKENDIRIEACEEYLKYTFTEKEKYDLGQKLAESFSNAAEAESRLKSVTTQIKSEIAKIEGDMASLSEKIRSGYEHRQTRCQKEMDYRLGTVTITRLDTGEVIRERPMEDYEKQQSLKLNKDAA